MKKEVWESSIKEVSIEEVAKDFCEGYELATLDINDFDFELNYFIEDNINEISPKERAALEEEIKKLLIKRKEEFVVQEKAKLKNRTSILEWIDYNIKYDDGLEGGNVGYSLSAEEILDLIIKNGQK